MNSIVEIKNNQAVTTSLAIAEGTKNQHKNVLELIRNYRDDFDFFGGVTFETRSFVTAGGLQSREIAFLNEPQSALLITYMRNTEIVRKFKIRLVGEFYRMAETLARNAMGQFNIPKTMPEALRLAADLAEENGALQIRIASDRPKVIFADAVEVAKNSILVGELAKLIRQNGVEIGQNRLFSWLRDNGWLMKQGGAYNMPTQKGMEMELFEIMERTVNNPDGSVRITKTTKVTGKGQQYFINIFLTQDAA